MAATYTKLQSGEWGIRVTGSVTPGAKVVVTKKSGETKEETVGKVVWAGNGISLCTITASAPARPSYQPQAGRPGKTYRKSAQAGGGRGHCGDDCYGCSNCM
jgi:hypothetical protein